MIIIIKTTLQSMGIDCSIKNKQKINIKGKKVVLEIKMFEYQCY